MDATVQNNKKKLRSLRGAFAGHMLIFLTLFEKGLEMCGPCRGVGVGVPGTEQGGTNLRYMLTYTPFLLFIRQKRHRQGGYNYI